MSIIEISVAELETALSAGARLIDVRETDEYQAGHVAGAVHVAAGLRALAGGMVAWLAGDRPIVSGGQSL